MEPIFTLLPFTYKKPSSEVWVLNTQELPLDSSKIKDQQLIILGPQAVGGNHKHARTEWFIALSPGLKLYWFDKNHTLQESDLFSSDESRVLLTEIPPHLPHAVQNVTEGQKLTLIEFADAKMKDPEFIQVI